MKPDRRTQEKRVGSWLPISFLAAASLLSAAFAVNAWSLGGGPGVFFVTPLVDCYRSIHAQERFRKSGVTLVRDWRRITALLRNKEAVVVGKTPEREILPQM